MPNGAVLFVLVVGSLESLPRRALLARDNADTGAVRTLTRHIREPDPHHRNIEGVLAKHLRHLLTTSGIAQVADVASTPRVSAAVSACRLVESRFPAAITLSDLARQCGVAARTLEYGFKQVYGTTPLAFFRSQRLMRSRMALQQAPERSSIKDTARAHGFTHMGQYSKDYRRLFGETPSMTLARSRSMRQNKSACPDDHSDLSDAFEA